MADAHLTTSQRGYGPEWQRLRRAWAEVIQRDGYVLCWRPDCGKPIYHGMRWDLGHDDADRAIVRGPEHQRCNRATATHGRATAARRLRSLGQRAARAWTSTDQP